MHAATDIDHADTQPVTPLKATPTAALTRFDAATRYGAISLHVEGTPAVHAAQAALLLDRCDALLDALDAWLHTALDWRWVQASHAEQAPRACATARCAMEGDGQSVSPMACRLELPWALLRSIGAPPDTLAARLQWSPAPAVLVVSKPAIDEAELRLLERGGAIVLPESMRAPWRGGLRTHQEATGDGVPVELPAADNARLAGHPASEAATAGGRSSCEVRMTATRPLDAGQLAGWAEGSTVELAPRASLWRCAGPTGAERFLAGGRLLPWGDGWAMLIESI